MPFHRTSEYLQPNCACAAADQPGHGPRFLWTRSAGSRKTVGRQLAAAEVEKVRREIARHAEFTAAVEQIAEVNEQICEARPVAGTQAPPVPERERVALRRASGSQVRRDMAAGRRGGAPTGLLKLGGSMLGQLRAANPGQRGPRLPCSQGHEAEFTDYRDKTFDTVLGPARAT